MVASIPDDTNVLRELVASAAVAGTLEQLRKQWVQKLNEFEVFEEAANITIAQEVLAMIDQAKGTKPKPFARWFTVETKQGTKQFQSTLSDLDAIAICKTLPDQFARSLSNRRPPYSQNQLAWLHKLAMDAENTPPSEWVGTIGSGLTVMAKVVNLISRHGRRGEQTVVKLQTIPGNCDLTWFLDGKPEFAVGDSLNLVANVKAHEEFRGRKQTILHRVKSATKI